MELCLGDIFRPVLQIEKEQSRNQLGSEELENCKHGNKQAFV
jgi:hypothetical protein